jgi:hypothetical protein
MVKAGWYCNEVSFPGKMANLVFEEWGIENLTEIDRKIFFLNKQPIPNGISLSSSDWTPINLTSINYSSVFLNPGIYWYQVIDSYSAYENYHNNLINYIPITKKTILDMSNVVFLESYGALSEKKFKLTSNADFETELENYRDFNSFGPPTLDESQWESDMTMLGILQKAKCYIGFQRFWFDNSGGYVYDYTKEYTLKYDFTSDPSNVCVTLFTDDGESFIDNIIQGYQGQDGSVTYFRGNIKLSFTEFYTREVIKITLNDELYYFFNHVDRDDYMLNEISSIRDIFVNRQIYDVNNNTSEGIFNAIISKYYDITEPSAGYNDAGNGFNWNLPSSGQQIFGNFKKLMDKFSTDDWTKYYADFYVLSSSQYMRGQAGSAARSGSMDEVSTDGKLYYCLEGGDCYIYGSRIHEDASGNVRIVNGGVKMDGSGNWFGNKSNNSDYSEDNIETNLDNLGGVDYNASFYYIAKGELLDENYVKVIDEISYKWKQASYNKPILSVLVNNREYGIFSHINSDVDNNKPDEIIQTILNENPSYVYTNPQNNNFLTNVIDFGGATKTPAEWEELLKGKVEEVFDGSRNSHKLIVPFTNGGIYGSIGENIDGSFNLLDASGLVTYQKSFRFKMAVPQYVNQAKWKLVNSNNEIMVGLTDISGIAYWYTAGASDKHVHSTDGFPTEGAYEGGPLAGDFTIPPGNYTLILEDTSTQPAMAGWGYNETGGLWSFEILTIRDNGDDGDRIFYTDNETWNKTGDPGKADAHTTLGSEWSKLTYNDVISPNDNPVGFWNSVMQVVSQNETYFYYLLEKKSTGLLEFAAAAQEEATAAQQEAARLQSLLTEAQARVAELEDSGGGGGESNMILNPFVSADAMHNFFADLSDEVHMTYIKRFVEEKIYIGHKKIEIQVEEEVNVDPDQVPQHDRITASTHIYLHGKKKVDGKWISISEPFSKSEMNTGWASVDYQYRTAEDKVSVIDNFAQQFMSESIGSIDISGEHYYDFIQLQYTATFHSYQRHNSVIDLYYDASGNPTLKFFKDLYGFKGWDGGDVLQVPTLTDLTTPTSG